MSQSGKSESRTLTDHDEIRKWVEARGGRPARVKGTGNPLPEETAQGEGQSEGQSEGKGKATGSGDTAGNSAGSDGTPESKKAKGAAKSKNAEADLDAGLLRIDFQEPDDRLEPVDWDMFFTTFEERKLALLCGSGKDSRFNKLIKREA
jgi:hypothetical protein